MLLHSIFNVIISLSPIIQVDTEAVDKVSTLISGPLLHMPKATKALPGFRPIKNVFCKPRRLASGLGLDDQNNTPTVSNVNFIRKFYFALNVKEIRIKRKLRKV